MTAKASAKHPFLPMFVGDFMAATNEWEGEEQALYSLLLMHQWALGHLPVEVTKLARLVRWDNRNFDRYWPTVASKFEARDVPGFGPRLVNPRLEDHRAKSQAISEKRSHIGKVGAEARWQNDGNSHTDPMANANAADGKSHDFANGKRNAIHPIPSHPIPDSPSRSSQAPTVTALPTRARTVRVSETGSGNAEADSAHATRIAIEKIYPRGLHRGDHWMLAERSIRELLEGGESAEALKSAAAKYCEQQTALETLGTKNVLRPSTFFSTDAWRGPFPTPQASAPKRMRTAHEIAALYPEDAT